MKAREIVCFSPQTGFQIVKLILVKHPEMQHFPGFPGQAGVRRERMPILKYQQKFEFLSPTRMTVISIPGLCFCRFAHNREHLLNKCPIFNENSFMFNASTCRNLLLRNGAVNPNSTVYLTNKLSQAMAIFSSVISGEWPW